jgi:oxygen-independent coproporphyrinogen-3 oxidase
MTAVFSQPRAPQAAALPGARPLSLYLHIPFCAVRCTYCAFNTYTQLEALIPAFVDALCAEIAQVGAARAARTRPPQPVHSIFFGGGTPTQLSRAQLVQVMMAVRAAFTLTPDCEISIEANPSDVDEAYAHGMVEAGFNRVSFGMQSVNAHELALFHRRHTHDDVIRAVSAVRAAGITNYNLDLIYGVPHQTMDGWQHTVEAALQLAPAHLSLYALVLEPNTAMHHWVERGTLPEPDDDLAADMYEWLSARLADAGFAQYEISNWALPGRECRHNIQYWQSDDYLGFGPGAHGFADGVRYWTVASPHRYIAAVQAGAGETPVYPRSSAVEEAAVLSRDDAIAEALLMGLRLIGRGIDRAAFAARFGVDLFDVHGEMLRRHEAGGLLAITPERVMLTEGGRLLSNLVLRDLV